MKTFTKAYFRRASLALQLLLLAAAPLAAQTPRDSALVRAVKQDLDSIARDKTAPSYSKRAQTRIRARADSLLLSTAPAPQPSPDPSPTPTPPPPVDTTAGIAALPVLPTPVYPACARTVRVAPPMDLQASINGAAPGDCLAIPAGATYVGNFTLPNRTAPTSSGWVAITTELPAGVTLPPPGTRITPGACARIGCAKILSPNYDPAFATAPAAHGFILRGLEISYTSAAIATTSNVLVRLTDPGAGTDTTLVPRDLQIDRSYLHGLTTLDMRRTVTANSRNTVVIDSWLSEVHSNNGDSQTIIGYNGTRGLVVKNNYLASGGEVLMTGGADPTSLAMSPSDIAYIGNHITRPIAWKGVWQVKNLIESKNARRLLIEGNVLENSWADAQAGFAVVLKSENQWGAAPFTTTSDVTIRYNVIRNAASAFNISGSGSNGTPNLTSARYTITQNYAYTIGDGTGGGDGIAFQFLNGLTDAQITRNTIRNARGGTSGLSFDGTPTVRLVVTGTAFDHASYGVKGSGTGDGATTLTQYAPGVVFTGNAIVGAGSCAVYPSGNTCPATFPTAAPPGADSAVVFARVAGVVVSDGLTAAPRAVARAGSLKYAWRATPPSAWPDYPRPWLREKR